MPTYDTTRFTTTPQRCVAPWYHQVEGVGTLYYLDADYEHQLAVNGKPVQESSEEPDSSGSAWTHEGTTVKVCAAEGCDREFTPRNPNQVTCGAARCRDRHRKAQRARYSQYYEAQKRDRPAVVAE